MGKMSNSQRQNCAYGGTPKMRDIGGVKAMPYGHSDNAVMREAKAGTTGKIGMSGIGKDGEPVKSRLDRPGRKAGGRVNRESGGPIISEDSKKEAARLRAEAREDRNNALMSAGSALFTGVMNKMPGGGAITKGIGHALTAGNAGAAGLSGLSSRAKSSEADLIDAGRMKPGYEDRKSGGPVKKGK